MQLSALLTCALPLTFAYAYPPATQETINLLKPLKRDCDCTGTNNTGKPGATYVCRDPRLGPKKLPRKFPLLGLVKSYDRFGGLRPGEYIAKWTDATGRYIYPPMDGFMLDILGAPIMGNMTLPVGTQVDRFGSEYGSYVSEAEAPYDQRALPPSNLDTNPASPDYPNNYHVYTVVQPLVVLGGPIAPWFGQPGLGAQFYTGYTGNILKLIDLGFLKRNNLSELEPAPPPGSDCD